MKNVKLFGAMGVIAHEKKPIWSVTKNADYKDTTISKIFNLPEGVETYVNESGETCFSISGAPAELISIKGAPVLVSEGKMVTLQE